MHWERNNITPCFRQSKNSECKREILDPTLPLSDIQIPSYLLHDCLKQRYAHEMLQSRVGNNHRESQGAENKVQLTILSGFPLYPLTVADELSAVSHGEIPVLTGTDSSSIRN